MFSSLTKNIKRFPLISPSSLFFSDSNSESNQNKTAAVFVPKIQTQTQPQPQPQQLEDLDIDYDSFVPVPLPVPLLNPDTYIETRKKMLCTLNTYEALFYIFAGLGIGIGIGIVGITKGCNIFKKN